MYWLKSLLLPYYSPSAAYGGLKTILLVFYSDCFLSSSIFFSSFIVSTFDAIVLSQKKLAGVTHYSSFGVT